MCVAMMRLPGDLWHAGDRNVALTDRAIVKRGAAPRAVVRMPRKIFRPFRPFKLKAPGRRLERLVNAKMTPI